MDLGSSSSLGHMKDPDRNKENLSSDGGDMQHTGEIRLNLRENLRQMSKENSQANVEQSGQENVRQNGYTNKDMKQLVGLLSKLNRLAKDFIPHSPWQSIC